MPERRLLFVLPRYLPSAGGTQVHTHEVAKRLARRGFDVSVATTDVTGRLPADETVDGVRILRVPAFPKGRDYFFAPGIARIVKLGRFDLVHCQGYHTFVAPMGMAAALRARIPYVLTFHSGGNSSALRTTVRRGQWWALRPLLARARRLIGVSRFEAHLFQTALHLPLGLFTVINNGGDLVEATDEDAAPGLIVSLGRLERYKGHQRAISALPLVLEHEPDARLVIVGSGPYEDELRRLAVTKGCADRVEIRSFDPSERAQFAALLARASLVTMLSDYEAHPIAGAEALYLGRPLLVLQTTGLSEFVEDGLARGVEPGAGDEAVADAIVTQLREPLVPDRARVPTWRGTTDALVAVYESILSPAAERGRDVPGQVTARQE